MPSLLTDLDIVSIGLVDKGASGDGQNRPAVLLFKRASATPIEKAWQGSLDKTIEFLIAEGKPQDQAAAIAHQLARERGMEKRMSLTDLLKKAFGKAAPELPAEKQAAVAKELEAIAKGICPKCGATIPDGSKFCPECGTKLGEGDGGNPFGGGKRDGGEPPVPAEVQKRIDAEVAKREALEKKLQDQDVVVKQLRDAEAERTFLAKIDREMKYVPGLTPAKLAKILKHASETLPKEEYEELEKSYKATSAAIKASNLIKTFGADGSGDVKPADQLAAIAKGLREKDSKLTEAQSIVKAGELNPELYAQVRAAG